MNKILLSTFFLILLLPLAALLVSGIIDEPYITYNKEVEPGVILLNGQAKIILSAEGEGNPVPVYRNIDVVHVLDLSDSMNDNSKLEDAKAAAIGFDANLQLDDKVGVAYFKGRVTAEGHVPDAGVGVSLTTGHASVDSWINSATAMSGTPMGLGISAGANDLIANSNRKVKVIILLTDGMPTWPNQEPWGNGAIVDEADKQAARESANAAKQAGIIIYAIGVGSDVDAALLEKLASSPSMYYFAPNSSALADIYDQIAKSIADIAATNIVITDVLPQGVSIVDADSCSYNESVRIITCNAGSLPINATISFEIVINVIDITLNHVNEQANITWNDYLGEPHSDMLNNPLISVVNCYNEEDTRLCPEQLGVCKDSYEVCTSNEWPGCDYSEIAGYEATETSCNDGFDNDCDGAIDSADADCQGMVPVCGNGIVELGEECDDGNLFDNDSCSSNCTLINITGGETPDGSHLDQECHVNFQCTEWSECTPSGKQYRTCVDVNDCSDVYLIGKTIPSEERSCVYFKGATGGKKAGEAVEEVLGIVNETGGGEVPGITGAAVGLGALASWWWLIALLLLITLLLLFFLAKKRRKKQK